MVMAWQTPEYAALCTGLGTVATAAGAFFVWLQISEAATTLYSSNSYTVQKDIIEASDKVSEAQDQILAQGKTPILAADLKRQAIRLDSLVEAVQALRNNGGIKQKTWGTILGWVCPPLSTGSYKLGDADLSSIRDACNGNRNLWRANPQ
jgi:hypothetical protein